MTNQEKKAELRKYGEAQAAADRLREEIARLYSKAEKMTTVLKLVPVGGGGDGRKIESAIEGIGELADRLGEQQSKANKLRRRIEDAISAVPDGRLRLLLEYKYIDGMTWEVVADKMGMSVRGATKMHGRALDEVNASSLQFHPLS